MREDLRRPAAAGGSEQSLRVDSADGDSKEEEEEEESIVPERGVESMRANDTGEAAMVIAGVL